MVHDIYEKLVDMIGNPSVPIVLVGNKCDLHMERKVTEVTAVIAIMRENPHFRFGHCG